MQSLVRVHHPSLRPRIAFFTLLLLASKVLNPKHPLKTPELQNSNPQFIPPRRNLLVHPMHLPLMCSQLVSPIKPVNALPSTTRLLAMVTPRKVLS